MNASARRALAIGLAAVLVVGIVIAVIVGKGGGDGGKKDTGDSSDLTVVTGVIGSEKKPFFDDPAVKREFAKHGLDVEVTTAGSRQIGAPVDQGGTDLKGVDFAFPSSAPATVKVQQKTGTKTTYAPFYSPMAIASFQPVVDLLKTQGIATQDAAGAWHFDVAKYLDAVGKGLRWDKIPGNTTYPNPKQVLVSSTDIRSSNSAAMYLSIASYVANGNNVVSNQQQQDKVIGPMSGLFLAQGFSASSSEDPFEDYLSQGIGSKPIVMIYEAQFLGQQVTDHDEHTTAITPDMVLMYPTPDVLSKHTVVPLTSAGDQVGKLLTTDPELEQLAARFGFRTTDPSVFTSTLKAHGVAAPPVPVDVIDPPSYESLESMITAISNQYSAARQAAGLPDESPTK